jgi:hypothetical protein
MIGGRTQRRPASNPICLSNFAGSAGFCPSPSFLVALEGDVDPYIIIFATLAVVVCLCLYSVLGQRTGSERPFRVNTFTYRLSMIAAVLCAVNYVAYEAKWYAAIEARLAPVAVPTEPAPVADSVPIYPTNYGTSAMIDVLLEPASRI